MRILMLLAMLGGWAATAQEPIPPRGFWDQVTIHRDEWGTPHVVAESLRALAFGFGYAQAQDHLVPMLLAYRVANGRAAEVEGETYAKSDEFALRMGHGQLAAAAFDHADPITRDLCEGFAQGVNAWLVDRPDLTPPWADGVSPPDILALLHCYLMSFAPFDLPEAYHRPAAAWTGNAWALGPSRSKTGEPILVINPHVEYAGPFQWYEAHLMGPGLNVAGATLFGLPVILQGHNGLLGWALTPNQADFADIFLEQEPRVARDPKSLMPFIPEEQLQILLLQLMNPRPYYVAGPGGLEERRVECCLMPRGPVVGRFGGKLCTYQVGGYRDFGALRQFFEMGRAQSLAEFQAALAQHQLPCFHVVYADRSGNIFYMYNVKVGAKQAFELPSPEAGEDPARIRLAPIDWTKPLIGYDPRYNWGDVIPPRTLPAILNPPSGYVQACGNPPWAATANAGLKPDAWPPWLVSDPDTYRARRVRYLLNLSPRSFLEVQAMVYDVLVPFALHAVPRLIEYSRQHPEWLTTAHPDVELGLQLLRDWNYVAEINSAGMTFFHLWWASYRGLAPQPANDTELFDAFLAGGQSGALALEAAAQATRLLRNEFQSVTVPWGEVHVIRRGGRETPMPGASTGQPVLVASDSSFRRGKWEVTSGFGFAMVVKFGMEPEAVSVAPFGASEDPGSRHFADQLELMADRRFKTARFFLDDVQRHTETALGRIVQFRPAGMDGLVTIRSEHLIEARMNATADAPALLPEGLKFYSVVVHPECLPREAPVQLEIEVRIPPELCPEATFPELAVYAGEPGQAWHRLLDQGRDRETRRILARDLGVRSYAVLGPEEGSGTERAGTLARTSPDLSASEKISPELSLITFPPREKAAAARYEEVSGEPSFAPVESPWLSAGASPPGPTEQRASTGQSAMAWGRVIELAPPGAEGLFRVVSEKVIGARLTVLSEAPGSLPPGFAAFTPCIRLECSSVEALSQVAVRLVVAPSACAEQTLPQLALYAYGEPEGWNRLEPQEFDASARTYAGQDARARIYAVLGPAESLNTEGG